MAANPSGVLPVRWDHLPDPRDEQAPGGASCGVVVGEWACRHFAPHVANEREPWEALLDDRQRAVFLRLGGGQELTPGDIPPLSEALRILEGQARQTLGRPLVLLYRIHRPGHRLARPDAWALVLPSGAQMIVRSRAEQDGWLTTCFFPSPARGEASPERRWRRLVQRLVLRYAVFDQERNCLRPHQDGDQPVLRSGRTPPEMHLRPRFVSPDEWGFRTDLANRPWRPPLQGWAPGPAELSPGFRLRPRHHRPEQEAGHG